MNINNNNAMKNLNLQAGLLFLVYDKIGPYSET